MIEQAKQKPLTTQEVAKRLGILKRTILTAINRHDHLQPSERFGQLF